MNSCGAGHKHNTHTLQTLSPGNVLIFDVWATVQAGLLVLLAQLLVLLWRSGEVARMMVWRLEMWSQVT